MRWEGTLPFVGALKSGGYAALFSFLAGMISLIPLSGRSLLQVHNQLVGLPAFFATIILLSKTFVDEDVGQIGLLDLDICYQAEVFASSDFF